MARIGDRAFLFSWQQLRALSQPSPEATTWQYADVKWCRHRYSMAATDHAAALDVYRLDHATWSIMVVAEHWWDQQRKPVRNGLWAVLLAGRSNEAVNWMKEQARRNELASNGPA